VKVDVLSNFTLCSAKLLTFWVKRTSVGEAFEEGIFTLVSEGVLHRTPLSAASYRCILLRRREEGGSVEEC